MRTHRTRPPGLSTGSIPLSLGQPHQEQQIRECPALRFYFIIVRIMERRCLRIGHPDLKNEIKKVVFLSTLPRLKQPEPKPRPKFLSSSLARKVDSGGKPGSQGDSCGQ